MKGQQINFRADPRIIEEFCRNARILGHSLSSLVMALMQATNLHMADRGELTFPIEFASKRDKMLMKRGEDWLGEHAGGKPVEFSYPVSTSRSTQAAETKPSALKEKRK